MNKLILGATLLVSVPLLSGCIIGAAAGVAGAAIGATAGAVGMVGGAAVDLVTTDEEERKSHEIERLKRELLAAVGVGLIDATPATVDRLLRDEDTLIGTATTGAAVEFVVVAPRTTARAT